MSTKIRFLFTSVFILSIAIVFFAGCGEDQAVYTPPVKEANALVLRPINLPTLVNTNNCYELWLVDANFTVDEDSNAIRVIDDELSLGKFYWNRQRYEFFNLNGTQRDSNFVTPNRENIYDYSVIAITVESLEDDGVRANNGLIYDEIEFGQPIEGQFNFYGRFSPEVVMDFGGPLAASYVFRTYSDDGDPLSNLESGIWFHARNIAGDDFRSTLNVPGIREAAGFIYEGWVVYPDLLAAPLSTGKFRLPFVEDLSNPYMGPYWYPNTPGEDFVANPPAGVEFPLNLVGNGKVVVTIEPYPDPDPAEPFPFTLFEAPLPVSDEFLDDKNIDLKSLYGFLPRFSAQLYTR